MTYTAPLVTRLASNEKFSPHEDSAGTEIATGWTTNVMGLRSRWNIPGSIEMEPPGKQVAVNFHQLETPKTSNPVA